MSPWASLVDYAATGSADRAAINYVRLDVNGHVRICFAGGVRTASGLLCMADECRVYGILSSVSSNSAELDTLHVRFLLLALHSSHAAAVLDSGHEPHVGCSTRHQVFLRLYLSDHPAVDFLRNTRPLYMDRRTLERTKIPPGFSAKYPPARL